MSCLPIYYNICILTYRTFQLKALKSSRKSLGRKLETSLKCKYISDVFLDKLSEITNDPGSKLSIYGRIKTKFEYENYLNHDQFETLTKTRQSEMADLARRATRDLSQFHMGGPNFDTDRSWKL